MERVKVRTDELLPKFKSKSDLYNVCKIPAYLPYSLCLASFNFLSPNAKF